jgi:uncharacterized repeat protein (TIGR02543 family)
MKKNKYFIITFIAIIGLLMVGCGDGPGPSRSTPNTPKPPPSLPELSGTLTITPNSDVTTGTVLTAEYNGVEEPIVTLQWYNGTLNVGSGQRIIPTHAGNYTVVASASGFQSKTSAVVVVTGEPVPQQFIVTFNGNGANKDIPFIIVNVNGTATRPYPVPTRDVPGAYSLKGWYKGQSLTNEWDFTADTVTGNITLYAGWIPLKDVGELGPGGGTIFYKCDDGFTVFNENTGRSLRCHYLEFSAVQQSVHFWDGHDLYDIADSARDRLEQYYIGTGRRNTQILKAEKDRLGISGGAAQIALQSQGGFTDWFLPNRTEMETLREYYNYRATDEEKETFNDRAYWSSNVYLQLGAAYHMTSDTWFSQQWALMSAHYVRVIRAF